MSIEFKAWPKIQRVKHKVPYVMITEKLDGTNACVIIEDGKLVGCQSRKRIITPENDNYGFAVWAEENRIGLETLGDGYHYGEWYGEGIQKNPLGLSGKHFALFDAQKWSGVILPDCVSLVKVLYIGPITENIIDDTMAILFDSSPKSEGIIVKNLSLGTMEKMTFESAKGKWVLH